MFWAHRVKLSPWFYRSSFFKNGEYFFLISPFKPNFDLALKETRQENFFSGLDIPPNDEEEVNGYCCCYILYHHLKLFRMCHIMDNLVLW